MNSEKTDKILHKYGFKLCNDKILFPEKAIKRYKKELWLLRIILIVMTLIIGCLMFIIYEMNDYRLKYNEMLNIHIEEIDKYRDEYKTEVQNIKDFAEILNIE